MCGIAGIVAVDGRPVDIGLLRRLCEVLRHRGPDEEGYHVGGPVGLGHRRLSVLDLDTGHQPIANEDGTVRVVFNGEIYNFRALRGRLESLGHRFATRSDTEVIVHAWEQYSQDCVSVLRGMFAFAVWDGSTQTLFLARDRVGKKPLFYAQVNGQFIFASELQSLAQHPALVRELDWAALDDYLTYGYIPAPRTIFRDVYKLPPAHHLTFTRGDSTASAEPRIERYWRLQYRGRRRVTEDEATEGLLDVLTEAVRLRLVADVPLGAMLSGGVDSSLVVALMSRLSHRPVKTFSIGFEEAEFNELPYARLVADKFATQHHELIVRPSGFEVLPTLVRNYGEPFADSSAVPTYYVARLTRDHVKVVLNGDGGDECLGGYERYLGVLAGRWYDRMPALVRRLPLARLIPNSVSRRSRLRYARSFLQVAAEPLPSRYLRWMGYLRPEQKAALYTADLREALGDYRAEEWLLDLWAEAERAGVDAADVPLAVDVESYLPYDLLVKMDVATMAASLEARSPFLDHEVMQFCAGLPSGLKIRRATLKYLLKKVGARFLPPEIISRRKMGFGVPVAQWLGAELRPWLNELLLSPEALKRGYFRPESVRRLVADHMDGRRDHSFELWALLWLELWHREFLP